MTHFHLSDRYQDGTSIVHRLDPRVRMIITLLFIVSNALLPDGAWAAFVVSLGLVTLVCVLARLGVFFALKRSFVALPFMLIAITVLFATPGQTVAGWQVGDRVLLITDAGVTRFFSILTRSWLSVQMAIVLTAVTNIPDLLHALRHLRVPPLLVGVIGLMLRYLDILADEALRLMRARDARSAGSGGSLIWRARVAGHMVGQLFLRSYERSERVHQAMLARGFDGRFLTVNPHHLHERDWWALAGTVSALALVQALGYML
ncbi:cobalt ECF transporter T component CbiQ [Roseiflexus sp.]|uniref:cobalt ECF transporter T component CbiQ n=1 Tax=Roseiflexus sp. TaxID=2562120 RepID=UPI00398B4196